MDDPNAANPAPDALLENIIALTEQRDQLSLEFSLFLALQDILEPELMLAVEWSGDQPEHRVVHTDRLGATPPRPIMEAARALTTATRRIVATDGHDYLLMNVEAMMENARRVLILGQPRWSESDLRMAGGMLRVYQNFVRLLNDSEKDTLTGLMNRKRLEKHLAELLIARRNGRRDDDRQRNDFLAVLDIDHFKRINDTFGHLIGDEVLLAFANVLRQSLRDEDRCYRYGGEEFIVLLSDISREQAAIVLERLRTNVTQHEFPQVGHVSVSVGYSLIEDQMLPTGIIEKADRALYYAKAHGRDQVREFQTLLAEGALDRTDKSGSIELF